MPLLGSQMTEVVTEVVRGTGDDPLGTIVSFG
jgi:hypothetical protein